MPTEKRPPRRPLARKAGLSRSATHGRLDNDTRKQLHALQVHQVELEMQNKELRQMRGELDASLSRYTALYESAPVGYLTLGHDGTILGLNRAAAELLGGRHRTWRQTRFDIYLSPQFRPPFNKLLSQLLLEPGKHECETEVLKPDGSSSPVQVCAAYQADTESFLVALIDASDRRDALRRAREAEQLAQKLLCQNRHLTRRMFELLEDDRRSIVHEIQHELGRRFSSIYREMAYMIRTEHRLRPETRPYIRSITASLAEMQNGLRRIMLRLRPTLLDIAGIGECVREFIQQWQDRHPGTRCELTLQGEFEGIPDAVNVALFRVAQGALTNVANHAHASRVVLRLERQGGTVSLMIDDNGEGFDPAAVPPGVGLLEMRERIAALDGQFELSTQPASGVRIEVHLPIGPPRTTPPRPAAPISRG